MYLQESESFFSEKPGDRTMGLLPGRGFIDSVFSTLRSSRIHSSLGAVLLLSAALFASVQGMQAQATIPLSPHTANGADYDNRYDIYGGFSDSKFTTTIGHGNKTNLMGGGGQGTVWLSPIVGAAARVSYVKGSIPINPNPAGLANAHMSETIFLFGPEFRIYRKERLTVYGHGLFGGTYGIFDTDLNKTKPPTQPNSVGIYSNQLAFIYAAGGAFDYNLSPKLSVRVITDFQPSYFGKSVQKEFAGGVGIVYKLGSLHKR
jgi:hypothetical protein